MAWTSGKLDSKYSLTLNHGGAYWDVIDGRWIYGTSGHMWAIDKKHHPDEPIPRAIYKALRAAPMNTLTLADLITLSDLRGVEVAKTLGYLRELNKQRINTMVDEGKA